MGAIYARVMEQVQKVASLLSIEEGIVTEDHVKYAFALINRCTDDTAFLLKQDAANKADATLEEIVNYTRSLIGRHLGKTGKTPSQLKQAVLKCHKPLRIRVEQHKTLKLAGEKPDLYERILRRMEQVGDVDLILEGKKRRYKNKRV